MSISVTANQKRALGVTLAVMLVIGAIFLRPYFTIIVFAGILAFIYGPFYDRQLEKTKNSGKAMRRTLLFLAGSLLIPLGIVLYVSYLQINQIAQDTNFSNLSASTSSLVSKSNDVLANLKVDFRIDAEHLQALAEKFVKNVGSNLLSSIPGFFSSFAAVFTKLIIFLYVLIALLKNRKILGELVRALSPVGKSITSLYIKRTESMTKGMVKGQFIIAFLQGLTDASLLAIAGLPELFFFFLLILTAFSIIPLGGGIIAIPIGVIMILTGHVWQGLLVILGHIIIVTNLDNVLRPKLVPKDAKLDGALTILGVFGGIKIFGFLGIVVGPVIMILITTTVQVFMQVYHNQESRQITKDEAKA